MPLIDKETVQRIKDAADIVEVVGDYVHLIRRGANYMGLCPFHNERTPSFSVNKRKNFCYCFSCKQGGSPVNFIMKKEGLSYHEALLHLAKKYGIAVEERELSEDDKRRQTEREAMFVANEWAMLNMRDNLFNTEEGRSIGLSYFFGQRGITQEACEAFRLGYAIDRGNALISDAKKKGIDVDVLKKVGLVGESQEGRLYDKYRGRVIFPIINTAGKVIGFGGRTLKNDRAKYINSPESDIYKKSNELYGIFQARASIKKEDKCFLVEGYFDVIGMWQSGLKNVVASSGTALTDGQITLIHRFTENITLIYDGDKAGIKAALRGVDMLLYHNMQVSVLLLPDGDDPDSFARKHTPEEFRAYVEQHETDVITFKAKALVNDIQENPQGRINAIQEMVTTLAHISSPIARDVYLQDCSRLMQIPQETILEAVVKKRAELVEGWKRERTKKEFSQFAPQKNSENESESGEKEAQATNVPFLNAPLSPLFPLERRIMEFVVKYGFILFCSINEGLENESEIATEEVKNEKTWWNITEFIYNELRADNIVLSNPVFNKIFSILLDIKEEFGVARAVKEEEIKKKSKGWLKEGYENIAQRNLTMSEIQREEKFLEKDIEERATAELNDFDRHYPIKYLSSHEDDEVREMATKLAVEPHQLSAIFYKDNNTVETEEDRLDILVPRAVEELKSEILNIQLKELYGRLANTSNADEEVQILKSINDKIHIRAILAKNLGERIVSPSVGGQNRYNPSSRYIIGR